MSPLPPSSSASSLGDHTGRAGDPAWYTRRVELVVYVLAGVSYVGLGVFHKWLLNWIIGPIWLVAWIWLAPLVVDRLRRREPASPGGAP